MAHAGIIAGLLVDATNFAVAGCLSILVSTPADDEEFSTIQTMEATLSIVTPLAKRLPHHFAATA
jgi:hypothetical protein